MIIIIIIMKLIIKTYGLRKMISSTSSCNFLGNQRSSYVFFFGWLVLNLNFPLD